MVAVPTTAGTGSELSRGAILSDHERKFKGGLRGNGLFPAVALVDPELSLLMPDSLARLTGFDVLCHAVETYFSRQSHAMLHSLSLGAVAVVRDCLMRPVTGLSERARVTQVAYASSMMGVNLGNATTCLPHRMQYAIGALTDTSHPEGLAALYPEWFAAVVKADPDKARRLLAVLFADVSEAEEAFADPAGAMMRVLEEIGVGRTLQELGVGSEEELKWCIGHVSGASQVDPAYAGPETIEQIFLSAFRRGC
jgi:alcohol dehydrogenase class IV